MLQASSKAISNSLLSALTKSDFALIEPHLEFVGLPRGSVLATANEPIEHVHFLDRGVASVVASRPDGYRIEVGIIGREGLCGGAVLLGSEQTPTDCFMQLAGEGHRIMTPQLRSAISCSVTLQSMLLRYLHVFSIQTAQTVLANGSSRVEERLARWLLMCQDRMGSAELSITHRFLSMMLCVRRASVTDTLHILEGRGLVTASRGKIHIRDRQKLKQLAGASYGLPEREYDRLIGR